MKKVIIGLQVFLLTFVVAGQPTHTKRSESIYEKDIRLASGVPREYADFAWHASATFGFECPEVIKISDLTDGGYQIITCSKKLKLRAYPRPGTYPTITQIDGKP